MRVLASGLTGVVLLFGLALHSHAETLDLGHPTISPNYGGIWGEHDFGVAFDAIASFEIVSAGIRVEPGVFVGGEQMEVSIYELTGADVGTRGPLLGTNATSIADEGLTFYDVPISFAFVAGKRYEVAFSALPSWSSEGDPGISNYSWEHYQFGYPTPGFPVADTVTVIDGLMDGDAPSSIMMSHARLNLIPEPSTLVLLSFGVASMLAWAFSDSRLRKGTRG